MPTTGSRSAYRPGLNEGLPQKGKRLPGAPARPGAGASLNEGLPQKGKRFLDPPYTTGANLPQ